MMDLEKYFARYFLVAAMAVSRRMGSMNGFQHNWGVKNMYAAVVFSHCACACVRGEHE
jgi:hypothetical protein